MNFGSFLGNESLKERLSTAEQNRRLSHCYLLTGPEGSGKHTLAKLLAAAMECTEGAEKPCLRCTQCKKVFGDTHPDLITVDEPEKKTVSVKLVRQACSDLYIRPNEGKKKIYLFPRAHDLNVQSQNALLKCIEEPPEYGVFLLLSEHAERLLPTIRSRCVELRLSPLPEGLVRKALEERFPEKPAEAIGAAAKQSGGYLGQAISLLEENSGLLPQAKALLEAYAKGEAVGLLNVLVPMERLKREQLQPILLQCRELLCAALSEQKGIPGTQSECAPLAAARSSGDLLAAADAFGEALTLLSANVSPAHICGMLTISL